MDKARTIRRLLENVQKDPDTDCWLWTGSRNHGDYGHVQVQGRTVATHRLMYELMVGPIPDGAQIDHRCYRRSCINPDHLRPATPQQNTWNRSGAQSNNRSSGVRNVTWVAKRGLWQVQAQFAGRTHFGGHYKELSEATEAAARLREHLRG